MVTAKSPKHTEAAPYTQNRTREQTWYNLQVQLIDRVPPGTSRTVHLIACSISLRENEMFPPSVPKAGGPGNARLGGSWDQGSQVCVSSDLSLCEDTECTFRKCFWCFSHPHGCFHMGKRAGLCHKCWNFYRHNISLVQSCQKNQTMHRLHLQPSWTAHTTPIAILPPRKQPETLSNFKNIPSSPHFVTILSPLAPYSIIWPPKKKATFIFSQATNKLLTQCLCGNQASPSTGMASKGN